MVKNNVICSEVIETFNLKKPVFIVVEKSNSFNVNMVVVLKDTMVDMDRYMDLIFPDPVILIVMEVDIRIDRTRSII